MTSKVIPVDSFSVYSLELAQAVVLNWWLCTLKDIEQHLKTFLLSQPGGMGG